MDLKGWLIIDAYGEREGTFGLIWLGNVDQTVSRYKELSLRLFMFWENIKFI